MASNSVPQRQAGNLFTLETGCVCVCVQSNRKYLKKSIVRCSDSSYEIHGYNSRAQLGTQNPSINITLTSSYPLPVIFISNFYCHGNVVLPAKKYKTIIITAINNKQGHRGDQGLSQAAQGRGTFRKVCQVITKPYVSGLEDESGDTVENLSRKGRTCKLHVHRMGGAVLPLHCT